MNEDGSPWPLKLMPIMLVADNLAPIIRFKCKNLEEDNSKVCFCHSLSFLCHMVFCKSPQLVAKVWFRRESATTTWSTVSQFATSSNLNSKFLQGSYLCWWKSLKLTFSFCHGVLSPILGSCTILSQKNIQPVCTRRSLYNITPHQEKPSALFHQTVHLINIISEWDADCNGGQDLMP
jgi:hypothetical protein